MQQRNAEAKLLIVDNLKIEIYPTRSDAGAAAAQAAAEELKRLGKEADGSLSIIFATGASQLDTLRALVSLSHVPWERICGFHMDEYVGIAKEHRASFRAYLRNELTQKVRMRRFYEVDGNAPDPDKFCQEYADALRRANPKLCLLGIGENGHLAFNDPPIADFNDPRDMKVVALDDACKQQQVAEGWFSSAAEVPAYALTLTIPALLRVPRLIASVPGIRKAKIVARTLREAISTACPATILREHPDATLYLDDESASEVRKTFA